MHLELCGLPKIRLCVPDNKRWVTIAWGQQKLACVAHQWGIPCAPMSREGPTRAQILSGGGPLLPVL